MAQMTLHVLVVEDHVLDFYLCRSRPRAVPRGDEATGGGCQEPMMLESVWQLMPQDLVETVLLFLPLSSQARFCCVCKRWRKVMLSLPFRERSSLIDACRGYPFWVVHLPLLEEEGTTKSSSTKLLKVRQVMFPGLVLPPGWSQGQKKVFGQGGLVVVGWVTSAGELRCWLLDLDDLASWREVPPLALNQQEGVHGWEISVGEGSTHHCFELFLVQRSGADYRATFHAYSSTTAKWQTVASPRQSPSHVMQVSCYLYARPRDPLNRRGFQVTNRVSRWLGEGKTMEELPYGVSRCVPRKRALVCYSEVLPDFDFDLRFGARWLRAQGSDGWEPFEVHESCGQWERPRPPTLQGPGYDKSSFIINAHIVAQLVLLVLRFPSKSHPESLCCHILAYDIRRRSWKRLPSSHLAPYAGAAHWWDQISLVHRPSGLSVK